MENMRILYLLLTIWTTAAGWAWAQQPKGLPTIATLDLTVAANYPEFIKTMRNKLSEKDKKGNNVLLCNMQKLSQTIPSPRYAYVDIKASATQTITLAIDQTNIYVMGYRDKFNGKDRAFLFKDAGKIDDLFPDAKGKKNRVIFNYEGQYDKLGTREGVPLGIKDFRTKITKIYGEPTSDEFVKSQKTFFLIALQMVAEATRFKYISDNIAKNREDKNFMVDKKVTALENGWGKLSKAIYIATDCSKLKEVVLLKSDDGQVQWTFKSVEDIAKDVGLLNAQKRNKKSPTNNDKDMDDDGGAVAVASS